MKQSIKKTNLLVALVTTLLFSTVATATVPKTVLVKAEPINQTQLTAAAHNSLKTSLAPIKITWTQPITDYGFAKQNKTANQNTYITLTKSSLMAE